MAVDFAEIKRLRELTGVGITKAEKRGEREARAGVISTYLHDNRIGVLLEVNSETDFVARNEMFAAVVKDIAMHIAASAPLYITSDDIAEDVREAKRAEFTEKVKNEGKPENKVPQIVEGMLKNYFAEQCLMDQPFIKNPDQTVGQYVKENIAKLGENLVVRRFSRMALGEVTE